MVFERLFIHLFTRPPSKIMAGAAGLSLLIACASAPDPVASVATMPSDQLREQYIDTLCRAYGRGQYENVRSELVRRGALTPDEWKMVGQHQIQNGMSVCGLLASWGGPGVHVTRNRSMLSSETVTDWTFQDCDH
ncbi:MAG TPA: hypothetical protein VFA47_08690, partial [Candidatus Manganitrophaceae bacterium]|nr:hypothetical protein [Candidatus Manganitrophaceae bacterium]